MSRPRIVFLEDEPAVADALQLLLQHEGYKVDAVRTADEFTHRLFGACPDLVILDVHIQGRLSGLDLCRWMRGTNRFSRVPILMLTNDSKKESVVQAFQLGANDYMLKANFDMPGLLNRIERLIGRREPGNQEDPQRTPEASVVLAPCSSPPSSPMSSPRWAGKGPDPLEAPGPKPDPAGAPPCPTPTSLRVLQRGLARLGDLKALPFLAQELQTLTQSGQSGASQLVETISRDQALAAKVLRFANSNSYRRGTRVTDLRRAVLNIGTNGLHDLVLGMSVVDLFSKKSQDEGGLDLLAFWKHSLVVAVIARRLAYGIHYPDPEEAFVAGLLHDLGKPILEDVRPAIYRHILRRSAAERIDLAQAEREGLGMDHTQAAREVAQRWKLPDRLVLAMSEHHGPWGEGRPRNRREDSLVAVVAVADSLAKALWLGNSGSPFLQEPDTGVRDLIPLNPKQVDRILDETEDETNQLSTILWTNTDPNLLRDAGTDAPKPERMGASVLLFGNPSAVAISPLRALCRSLGCEVAIGDPSTFPTNVDGNIHLAFVGAAKPSAVPSELAPYVDHVLFALPAGRSGVPLGAKRELPSPYRTEEVLRWLEDGEAAVSLVSPVPVGEGISHDTGE